MAEENVLQQELDKLDVAGLKRIAQLWNIPKIGKDKKTIIKNILQSMQDEFYLKGVLEKLSATQVTIYTSILKSKSNILTLGEISRKISMPPVNTEMELGVLKRYFLVYQRKNRERLTNNLDKYYYYPESGSHVLLETNEKGQKFRLSFPKILQDRKITPEWKKILGNRAGSGGQFNADAANRASENENLDKIFAALNETEREVVLECFLQGGVLEINRAREIISSKRGKWEDVTRHLNDLGLLLDEYYIDEKFIRALVLPQELFQYLQDYPLLQSQRRRQKRQEKKAINDLDFYLNIKKMISYISRKGLNLAKSGKIKQVDLKETENRLLRPDISLFIEKSQIYQIELLLPVMRLLDIVRVKQDDVVLRNNYEEILSMPDFELLDLVFKEMAGARNRRVRYEDVFEPMYVPFFMRSILDECVGIIQKREKVMYFVIMATLIREKLVKAKNFRIKNFQQQLAEMRRELTSALFYLQLLGFVTVEYPDRWVELSELGMYYLKARPLDRTDEQGGVIINPDLSLIAIPEKVSIQGISTLKCFAELKTFDNVYTFQITRESFQEGLLLKYKPDELVSILKATSRGELSQNLTFSIEDWSRTLPLVTITDECVVLQTQDSNHMELLLGQIAGKKIVLQKISPTTIIIDQDKIYETIAYAEKLNLIVKLIR
ncbi:MAG: helicase-associated domain-containing protein [Leptospiraceae bacterium]|nr:helicase-associated domain-containing protein [Leptospiraceae bacterium]MCB1314739.1 helicase-associated domain-containing protein [Leptospiraceae bacterium]